VPRHPLSEAPAPVKNSGTPLGKIDGQTQLWPPPKAAATFWFAKWFFTGAPRILHQGWCLAEGVLEAFPDGFPKTPGICEEGSPGTGGSQRVSTALLCLLQPDQLNISGLMPFRPAGPKALLGQPN
jgi:hypothetical protein